MAWKPFSMAAPSDVAPGPVADGAGVEPATATGGPPAAPDAAGPLPQSENLSRIFEQAVRERETTSSDAPAAASAATVPPGPATGGVPSLPRLGGATRVTDATRAGETSAGETSAGETSAGETSAATPAEPRFSSVPSEPTPAAVPPAGPAAAAFDEVTAEQARLERERAARREARMAALAPVREDDPLAPAPAPPAAVRPAKRVTDRFAGSLGLFALRAVTAMILFVHGLNGINDSKTVVALWSNTVLPEPRYVALGVSVAQLALAILLLFGVLTRLAGLLLLGVEGATLAFVLWGPWSIFEPGGTGFIGEHELLLAVVGLTLLFVGAGGWSVDYMVRHSRRREGLEF